MDDITREIGFGYGGSNTKITFKGGSKNPLGEKQVQISARDIYKGTHLGFLLHIGPESIQSLIDFLQNELDI